MPSSTLQSSHPRSGRHPPMAGHYPPMPGHHYPMPSYHPTMPSHHHLMPGHHATPPPALVNHHPTIYPPNAAMVSPPGDNPSDPYTHQRSAHPTTQPFLPHPPINATLAHQPEHLTRQDYPFAEQIMPHVERHLHLNPYLPAPAMISPYFQQPPHFAPSPFPPCLYPPPPPTTHPDRPIFYPVHALPGSQIHGLPQSSVTIAQLEYSIDQVHQQSLWKNKGMPEQSHQPQHRNQGMFSGSHDLVISDSTLIDNSTTSDNFMKDFLLHTIIGAEHDSSARDPPPRCHPGTRLAILGRCKAFIDGCDGKEKMRWIVGCAGVGKSAVMQMVAEETPADASVFLSVNGRDDGTKTFTTIAYQLAAKYKVYRQFIQNEISGDPSLLRKALSVQFQKFIADPFIHRQVFDQSRRFIIIIDGLDECDNPLVQEQLLELISRFCISCPTSPVVWFIASRPEAHITSFFEKPDVLPAYTKEEMAIDSDDACVDVQCYLRDELKKIKLAYPTLSHRPEWPSELEFTKIATAAGGLFAYASTVVRYINDPYFGDPMSRLGDVLTAIDKGLNDESSGKNNPLALLDALYTRIISKIPHSSVINAKKILLLRSNFKITPQYDFRMECNVLGLTEDAAYAALRHLHAVVKVPAPDKADYRELTFYHKSFQDFLFDPLRSEFCSGPGDFEMLRAEYSSRIVEQVPASFYHMGLSKSIKCGAFGDLRASASIRNDISLSWPRDKRFSMTDHGLRRQLYAMAMREICSNFHPRSMFFWKMSYFNHLTTRFITLDYGFPFDYLLDFVFNGFRNQLTDLGRLEQVPAWSLDYAAICTDVEIQLTCPVGMDDNLWSQDCTHNPFTRMDEDDLQDRQCLGHRFSRSKDRVPQADIPRFNIRAIKDSHRLLDNSPTFSRCFHCSQRLARQLINNPDTLATVFVDATELCYVEWSFVDPDDGLSEWTYRFGHSGAPRSVD